MINNDDLFSIKDFIMFNLKNWFINLKLKTFSDGDE